MIRRLVEHEQIDRLLHDLSESDLRRLAARERRHLCRDVLIRQAARSKRRAHLEVRHARVSLPELIERRVHVAFGFLLLEVADRDELALLNRAREWLDETEQGL